MVLMAFLALVVIVTVSTICETIVILNKNNGEFFYEKRSVKRKHNW